MEGKLQGRVAVVYGAGSVGEGWGNGKASAVAYARAGAKVACIDMNEAAAQATAAIINGEGGDAIAVKANVTDLDQVRAATDAVVKAFGRLDVLHNNVGITAAGGPVEASEESWDRVMSVNVKSMFFTCKRLSRNVWRGWMAGARCDSGRLSKPVWTASCGPRPPVGGIAASTCVTQAM